MAKTMSSGGGKSRKRSAKKLRGKVAERIETSRADVTQGETRKHNEKARAQIIVETFRKLQKIDDERKALNAEASEVKNTYIKGALGMKTSDFMAAYRYWQLEPDDRAQFMDTLRETFEAAKTGDQMDFLEAQSASDKKTAAKIAQDTKAIEDEGEAAGRDGKFPMANPYEAGTPQHGLWETGRLRGQRAIADGMGPKATTTHEVGRA